MAGQEDSMTGTPQYDDVIHIAPVQAQSPLSPTSSKRFIVEPQVLNAALEVEERRPPGAPCYAHVKLVRET